MLENKLKEYFTPSKLFILSISVFILGIFVGGIIDFRKEDFYVLSFTGVALLFIAFLWKKNFPVLLLSVECIIFLLAIIYWGAFVNKVIPKNLPYGSNLTITGIVIEEPDIGDTKVKYTIKISDINPKDNMSHGKLIGQKTLVSLPRYPEYKYGDKLKISGQLEKPDKINNFEYDKYLSRYYVFSLITNVTNVECIENIQGNILQRYLYIVKDKFENIINQILPEPLAALLAGILLGARSAIPSSLLNIFNSVGVTHIIAVSGYNVTIIVGAFERFAKYWSRKLIFILSISGLLAFVILAGATSSVVRAAIMASLFLIAKMLGREKNILSAVFFVAFIMILINPFILRYDVGFQLSFLAMIGLIVISPVFDKIFKKITIAIREPLSATLGAQIVTFPIILYNFGRLSIISPIANILILPIVPFTMGIGLISGILGMIWLPLGQIAGWICWVSLKYIVVASELLAKIPFASIQINFSNWLYVLLLYLIIYVLFHFFVQKIKIIK